MVLERLEFLELLLVVGVHGDDLVAAGADSAEEGGLRLRRRRHWSSVMNQSKSEFFLLLRG